MKRRLLVLIMMMTMILLAACSSGEKDNKGDNITEAVTQVPEATVTPVPTATFAPTPTSAPTPTPELTLEPEPSVTIEPTEMIVPTGSDEIENNGTGGEDSEAGGENNGNGQGLNGKGKQEIVPTWDIDEYPGITCEPDIYFDYSGLEVVYTEFDPGVSDDAKVLADIFAYALVTYDADTVLETFVCDEENQSFMEGLPESFEEMRQKLAEETEKDDWETLVSIEVLGGKVLEPEIYDYVAASALVDIEEVSELQVITAGINSSHEVLNDLYDDTYINVVIGKYLGEYKVITIEPVFEDDPYIDPDITDPVITLTPEDIEGMMYNFTGSETSEDIADMFIDACSQLDMPKIYSCIAMDDETKADAIEELCDLVVEMELARSMLDENSIKITRGEAEDLSEEEQEELFIFSSRIEEEDVSDVVKYLIHVETNTVGNQESTDSYLYVGKYRGEYRVVYTDLFD